MRWVLLVVKIVYVVIVAVVIGFLVLYGPFRQFTSKIDLASGERHYSSSTWWGLRSRSGTAPTWVSEHASPHTREPVIGLISGASDALMASGSRRSGGHKHAWFDTNTLRRLDEAGKIPEAMKTPLADAVIRQWLLIEDDLWGDERDRDSIAASVEYLSFNDVMLTAVMLDRLEAGETWAELLYPE
ncbi:MAG: hypothetical protein AAGF47_01860 [Planctomycetota bacterium]